jgi:hypothetical protein
MILPMVLSILFTIIDICAVTDRLKSALPISINPFWKLAFVFKLLTDSVILDDFKSELDKLSRYNLSRFEDRLDENWATSKNIKIHRERRSESPMPPMPPMPPSPPNVTTVAVGGVERCEWVGPWIAVTTET